MTVPASPLEGGGKKILFLTYDNSGANAAALIHGKNAQTVNSETYGDLVVTLDGETVTVSAAALGTVTHSGVNVATTSGTALAANSNRKYALLINDSDTTIYLNLGTAVATLNNGVRVNGSGGAYEFSGVTGARYTGVITAIHGGSGSKKLLVTEGT